MANPLGEGVTYHMGEWHHPLTALDRPARFAVFMWRDGTSTDEEFRTLTAPFTVALPSRGPTARGDESDDQTV
jgi:ureidoglycolate hydrolase